MKTKLSKKEFRSLLISISASLITITNHHIIDDEVYISHVWQMLARTALLDYPQNDLLWFSITNNYLLSLCQTLH